MSEQKKSVAVILSGCGFLDGAEIRESVAVLWALDVHNCDVACFSLNQKQTDVVNHISQEALPESRNVLQESARIARGKIKPIEELQTNDFDALAFPGGFGVAKNLCDFAMKGAEARVSPKVEEVIQSFYANKKPILGVCIAPALLGLALKKQAKLQLTLGATGEASAELEKLGHVHEPKQVHEVCVDTANKIVTTPAYMFDDAKLKDLFVGVDSAVEKALALT